MDDASQVLACSFCFRDHGLQLDAYQIGFESVVLCPRCHRMDGKKLHRDALFTLAYRFFDWGSFEKCEYGGYPRIVFNQQQETSVPLTEGLKRDALLFKDLIGVGFFEYGPRFWMFGEVEPLKALQGTPQDQLAILDRIVREYPIRTLSPTDFIYRVRKAPKRALDEIEYDSPPNEFLGKGRLDSVDLAVLYASPDLETCVHEGRFTAEDDLYVASLQPSHDLKLLNLSALLIEDGVTEFESLDLALNMLFLAGTHSYPITRAVAKHARVFGFDGLVYPSYFSMLRLGHRPFQTVYGISQRRIQKYHDHEESKSVPNVAVFGRPLADGALHVAGINRLIISRVSYEFMFGPVLSSDET